MKNFHEGCFKLALAGPTEEIYGKLSQEIFEKYGEDFSKKRLT